MDGAVFVHNSLATAYLLCNSCIMYLSDLPDIYSGAIRPESVGVHIRQMTRAHDTTDTYHDNA